MKLQLLPCSDNLNPVAVVISFPRCISHIHSHTHTHTHKNTPSHTLKHIQIHRRSHTSSHTISPSLKNTLSLSHTHTHAHTNGHTPLSLRSRLRSLTPRHPQLAACALSSSSLDNHHYHQRPCAAPALAPPCHTLSLPASWAPCNPLFPQVSNPSHPRRPPPHRVFTNESENENNGERSAGPASSSGLR